MRCRGFAETLAARLGTPVPSMTPLSGGDTAAAFRVDLDDGTRIFAKTHASPPPHFFDTEASGLAWLRDADAVAVPEVLAVSDGDPAFLALSWVEPGRATTTTESTLGRQLAAMHAAGAPSFGRSDHRTTGSLALPNEPSDTWASFFAEQRLVPLVQRATDRNALPARTRIDLERLANRIETLGVPEEPPARLHGDLWAGNRLVGEGGVSWLLDPAAHGGHREFDLAMMQLFGGFGSEVFAAYDDVYPLADGWRERIPIHQLAPLIVHAIKFGGGYVEAVERITASL